MHFNITDMIQRRLRRRLLELLDFYPAVGLIGARQVGKTTLVQMLIKRMDKPVRYFDLERHEDHQRLISDPGFILDQFRDELVVIDEVQRLPELFTELRSLIDRYRLPGRFLLLGSASPLLMRNTSESLAGRIGYLTLEPFHLEELGIKSDGLIKHWWRGGFPNAWLAPSDELSMHWRESFIRTYVERDLQFFGLRADPVRFRIFLQMLSVAHGNLWNAEALGRSTGVSGKTIKYYLSFLESSFFVKILHPYFKNIGKRLTKSPKVYINDSGILHALLGIRTEKDLIAHPSAGASWEGYAISQIVQAIPNDIEAFFFRTSDGTECDLILKKGADPISCIEIKLGNAGKVSKGFYNIINTLSTSRNFIITHSSDDYFITERIRVINFLDFIDHLPDIISA